MRRVFPCMDCDLPDPYNGGGDGIGSCDCPCCPDCLARPGFCNCAIDAAPWDDADDEPLTLPPRPCPTTVPERHELGEFPMTCWNCHMEADS